MCGARRVVRVSKYGLRVPAGSLPERCQRASGQGATRRESAARYGSRGHLVIRLPFRPRRRRLIVFIARVPPVASLLKRVSVNSISFDNPLG